MIRLFLLKLEALEEAVLEETEVVALEVVLEVALEVVVLEAALEVVALEVVLEAALEAALEVTLEAAPPFWQEARSNATKRALPARTKVFS